MGYSREGVGMLKFQFLWTTIAERYWETAHVDELRTSTEARAWAAAAVTYFNETLRPGERPRRFEGKVRVFPSDLSKCYAHKWEKKSLVTERGGYDIMLCRLCGATGRRYGLSSNVTHIESPKKRYA